MSHPQSPVSSPVATGGGGTLFEQHVGAFWLTQLLTKAVPPILVDCTVDEVSFQTERLGWCTDDFLVVGVNGSNVKRRLIGQAKKSFKISSSDPECEKAFLDFWSDYKATDRFSAANDKLVLAVLRGSDALLRHLGGLLEHARATRNGRIHKAA